MLLSTALLLVAAQASLAESPAVVPVPAGEPEAKVLEAVVVSGTQPGPGLWRVSRDGREFWILGTLAPLPRRMQWAAEEVEATIARSGEVVLPPAADLDWKGGALRGVFLIPAALGARNNPDDQTLADVLPAADYARWTPLKARYIGRSRAVEKRRPLFAAWKLYEEALDSAGLSLRVPVAKVVERAAQRHDVPLTKPEVRIVLDKPGATLKDFARSPLDDLECFRRTLAHVESDLGTLQLRANAWATGDLELLRSVPFTDATRACLDAVFDAGFAQRSGMDNLEERLRAQWLQAVEAALARHATSFGMLPISLLLREDGWLAALRERGYAVETPWEREARELEDDEEPVLEVDAAPRASGSR
jgi:uncharacterized protein YbaP (TraB family)